MVFKVLNELPSLDDIYTLPGRKLAWIRAEAEAFITKNIHQLTCSDIHDTDSSLLESQGCLLKYLDDSLTIKCKVLADGNTWESYTLYSIEEYKGELPKVSHNPLEVPLEAPEGQEFGWVRISCLGKDCYANLFQAISQKGWKVVETGRGSDLYLKLKDFYGIRYNLHGKHEITFNGLLLCIRDKQPPYEDTAALEDYDYNFSGEGSPFRNNTEEVIPDQQTLDTLKPFMDMLDTIDHHKLKYATCMHCNMEILPFKSDGGKNEKYVEPETVNSWSRIHDQDEVGGTEFHDERRLPSIKEASEFIDSIIGDSKAVFFVNGIDEESSKDDFVKWISQFKKKDD